MSCRSNCSVTFLSLVLSLAGTMMGRAEDQHEANVPFTISEETTSITEPRGTDGLIDYAAALNRRMSEGVTPETNAAVLFYQAVGPQPTGVPLGEEFFQRLGMPLAAAEGDYFIPYEAYLQQRVGVLPGDPGFANLVNQQEQTWERPWKPADFPQVAQWLEFVEEPLELIVAASKRRDFFSPILLPEGEENDAAALISVRLDGVQLMRSTARALSARAMLRAGMGKTDEAWEDVLAIYRLGHLAGQGSTMVEGLLGIALQGFSMQTALALIDHAEPDAALARRWLEDVKQLPAPPDMAEKIDVGERFLFLDAVQRLATGKMRFDDLAAGKAGSGTIADALLRSAVDWDTVLKMGNSFYDRFAAAMAIEDAQERYAALQEIEQDQKRVTAESVFGKLFSQLNKDPRHAAGEAIGQILVKLVLPAARVAQVAEDRGFQQKRNLELALALAAYRSSKDGYPESLQALSPSYIDIIPEDIFASQPLKYERTEDGYLLYSVGANRKDDEGRSFDDQPPADDVRVQMSRSSSPAEE